MKLENVRRLLLGNHPQEEGDISIVVLPIERVRICCNTVITSSALLRALLPNLEHFWLLLWELRWLPSLLLS
jgi:hypothetical protein